MKTVQLVAVLVWSASLSAGAQEAKEPLAAAKALYLAASYQEALAALDTVTSGDDMDEAAKYRALCLLGLNRPGDAEEAIEHLIERRPMFTLDALDSPKLRSMFLDARTRVLPVAATNLYQQARASFDRGELATAKDQFATVIELLGQPEVASQPSAADLKLLSTEFAKLVDQQLVERERAKGPAPAAPAVTLPAEPAPEAPAPDRIYGENDATVVPPVPLSQTIPPWVPPTMEVRSITFAGAIDVVIDERGAVTSVAVTRPTIATYDRLLVDAARTWRYRPASQNGKPVKYRKTVHVTLRPSTPGPSPQIQ